MKNYNYEKFNKFIFYPDFSYKFLIKNVREIYSTNNFTIYFLYALSQKRLYNLLAVKTLLMVSSIYPKNPSTFSEVIILKYTKARFNSFIFMKLNLKEAIHSLTFFSKRPIDINKASTAFFPSKRYFIFPGFIQKLRLPSWERPIMLSYNKSEKRTQYLLFFYKIAYLD